MICCFIGHREIERPEELKERVRQTVENLVSEGVDTFAFGSRSDFNSLCHEVVTEAQKNHPIKRVKFTCRSESCTLEVNRAHMERLYSKSLKREVKLEGYEQEVEHKNKYVSGRASYVERNEAMIDFSDICVFYFNENYKPAPRKAKKGAVNFYQPQSGTSLAYRYALQKHKKIINLYE